LSEFTGPLSGLKILIAEDAEINLEMLLEILSFEGAQSIGALNGRQAVEKALSETFDLILMDIQMPELDGIEATQKIRSAGLTVPIVAMTAADESEAQQFFDVGMNGFYQKPVNTDTLIDTILQYTSQKS